MRATESEELRTADSPMDLCSAVLLLTMIPACDGARNGAIEGTVYLNDTLEV